MVEHPRVRSSPRHGRHPVLLLQVEAHVVAVAVVVVLGRYNHGAGLARGQATHKLGQVSQRGGARGAASLQKNTQPVSERGH